MTSKFLLLFVLVANMCLAQLTLENTYTVQSFNTNLTTCNLVNGGTKYVMTSNNQIRLYNLNHSIYKTITPVLGFGQNLYTVYNISDNLFDSDSNIEVMYMLTNTIYSYYIIKIMDEEGTVKNTFNSTSASIVGTSNGYKLIVAIDSLNKPFKHQQVDVYSLPGTQVIMGNKEGFQDQTIPELSVVPNPSNDICKIFYSLTADEERDIIIYDLNGKEVKRFKVDSTFNHIVINNTDLPAGTYMYQIEGTSPAKQMIIVH